MLRALLIGSLAYLACAACAIALATCSAAIIPVARLVVDRRGSSGTADTGCPICAPAD
jgi:hypothetical protein